MSEPAAKSQKAKRARKARGDERRVRPVTADYLERAALHYLGRYSATEARLRDVLSRKVQRRAQDFTLPNDEQKDWIEQVVAKCVRLGYVDDAAYARMRATSLLAKGKTLTLVTRDLVHKGIAMADAQALVDSIRAEDPDTDWHAAIAYAKRRGFGPFARTAAKPADKQIAAMVRAGFPYDKARRIVEATSIDQLENPEN